MNQTSIAMLMPMLISRHIVSDICVALVDPRVRFGE
jgi:ABC-type dipeptide/oligopeptide/nickel transport system permease component